MVTHEHKEQDCAQAYEDARRATGAGDYHFVHGEVFCGCPHGRHFGVLFVGAEDETAPQAIVKGYTVGKTGYEVVDRVAWPEA